MVCAAYNVDRIVPCTDDLALRRLAAQNRVAALARWDDRISRALQRGDWDLAAFSEECAAIVAHELGLLDDGQSDLIGVHRIGTVPTEYGPHGADRALHVEAASQSDSE